MGRPYVAIDLGKIEHNARAITTQCAAHGISVCGVTKGTCGSPEVARAMLRGGVSSIGESRMENVERLRAGGIGGPFWLLRLPPLSEVECVVARIDVSLNSELAVLEGLSTAAVRRDVRHKVIVMVDLGDLREGVWPDDLVPFVREAVRMPGIRMIGLGANLTCYGGVLPTSENMGRLVECVREVETTFGLAFECVSGGNSSALPLIASGGMPERIDHVRIGEAILLGRETVHREPWPDTHQDAFRLHAEVIELKEKPSVPLGPRGADAFGRKGEFPERGELRRALLNLGREDVDVQELTCLDARLGVLGASSDYLIVDASQAPELRVGDELVFGLGYAALLAVMDSEYVVKRFREAAV